MMTSPDGISWTTRYNDNPYLISTLHSLIHSNNSYVAVGLRGLIETSFDGVSWVVQNSPTENYLSDVAYGNNQYVIVGNFGTILTSQAGDTIAIENSTPSSGIPQSNLNFKAYGSILLGNLPAKYQNCEISLSIYNVRGQLVQSSQQEVVECQISTPIGNLSNGVYLVEITRKTDRAASRDVYKRQEDGLRTIGYIPTMGH